MSDKKITFQNNNPEKSSDKIDKKEFLDFINALEDAGAEYIDFVTLRKFINRQHPARRVTLNGEYQITFKERYDDEDSQTTTLDFIAPKEMLEGKYPDAEHMTIRIEILTKYIEAGYPVESGCTEVLFSPTKDGINYHWLVGELAYDEIKVLADCALKPL